MILRCFFVVDHLVEDVRQDIASCASLTLNKINQIVYDLEILSVEGLKFYSDPALFRPHDHCTDLPNSTANIKGQFDLFIGPELLDRGF